MTRRTHALRAELVVAVVAAVLVATAFAYLFWLQQHDALRAERTSPPPLCYAVAQGNADSHRRPARPTTPAAGFRRLLATALVGAAAVEIGRDLAAWLGRRRPR